jgi:superfamily I DNA/RNA helicase
MSKRKQKAGPKFDPTAEQLFGRRTVLGGGHTQFVAYAGASKTTSLIFISDDLAGEEGQYLAFNTDVAKEASTEFGRHVECRTTHSLAFHAVAKKYLNAGKELPGRNVRRQRIHEVAAILGVNDGYRGTGNARLSRNSLTYLVMQTVTKFCYSADAEINPEHVPWSKNWATWTTEEIAEVKILATHFATKAWADIMALQGNLNYQHDYYLKQYQLTYPKIKKDFLMLDEGQDTNPAVLDIFERQRDHCQLIMVGDGYQSIYQWRGAIDAMSAFIPDDYCYLTKSFRFGPPIAEWANKFLTLLGAEKPLVGFEGVDSIVGPIAEPRAILCRTNATVIAETLHEQEIGRSVYVQGGTGEIKAFAEAAQMLMAGQPAQHPELIGFENWDEVREYATADESAKDLRTFVKLLDDYGVDKVLGIAASTKDKPEQADVITSTAHKSKGKQYSTVRIAADFEPSEDEAAVEPGFNDAENRLAYVALTRAQFGLDCEALSWVNGLLPTTNDKKDVIDA